MDTLYLSVKELHDGLVNKNFSAAEIINSVLDRIRKIDSKLKCFLTVCEKTALEEAEKVDDKIMKGRTIGILEGIPYSAKDVFSTYRVRTTASSKILDNYIPPYEATSIRKLRDAGAILIGKTNNDAFGFGSSTENSDYQVTKNPWDIKKVPGGSSGGSAAAVAAGMGVFSMGEDTGGSIRQPACFCGVSGLKVTYGRVSRYGVLAFGSSLDTVGVLARSIEDMTWVLKVIAGLDENDATTLPDEVPDFEKSIHEEFNNPTIGIPEEYFIDGMNKEVVEAVMESKKVFEKLGAKVINVSLPHTKNAIAAYYLSGISEVSANLSRYDGIRFGYSDPSAVNLEDVYELSRSTGFGDEVKRRIMLGTYALSAGYYDAFYKKAQKVRTLLKKDFDDAFKKVDFLIAPVSPFPAFSIGEKANDPLQMWLADVFTVTINPAGVPALAIPCGFTKNKLPIGMQLIGPQLSEPVLFRAGFNYQKKTNWHNQKPPIIT